MFDLNLLKLVDALQQDQPYGDVERLEFEIRAHIRRMAYANQAREVAELVKRIGFLLKYKPYGVKCSTLLGYSVFFLHEKEGFSFQRHAVHKTELFHFVDVLPGGYVFVGEQTDIVEATKRGTMQDWWQGKNNAFDRFVRVPTPGDAFEIERTGIVHTAIGCVLEEYANVSTDMVERLFDQNAGRRPVIRGRSDVLKNIAKLHVPIPTRAYTLRQGAFVPISIVPVAPAPGVRDHVMHEDANFAARRVFIEPGFEWTMEVGPSFVSLFCSDGRVTCAHADTPSVLQLNATENTMFIPGSRWTLHAHIPCALSILSVPQDLAFL